MVEKFFDNGIDYLINNSKNWRNTYKIYIFSIDWLIENILTFYKNKAKEIKKGRRRQKGLPAGAKKQKEKTTKQRKKLLEDNNQLSSEPEDAADPKEINGRINEKLKLILDCLESICLFPLKELFKNKIIDDEVISLTFFYLKRKKF